MKHFFQGNWEHANTDGIVYDIKGLLGFFKKFDIFEKNNFYLLELYVEIVPVKLT